MPELYLTAFPIANAATIGTEKPIVVLHSELIRLLDDDGRRAVLAHEAAHVHSGHVLYQTALLILLRLGAPRGCRCSRGCRCWRSSSRCSSGSARRSSAAIAPPRCSRATRWRSAARSWSCPPARRPPT